MKEPCNPTPPANGEQTKDDAPESLIRWLLASSAEEDVVRNLTAFVRVAQSALRDGTRPT